MRFVHALTIFYCAWPQVGLALDQTASTPPGGFAREIAMVNVSQPEHVEEAEDFLSKILPQVTAANPKYRSGNSADLTRWLTKGVRFSASAKTSRH